MSAVVQAGAAQNKIPKTRLRHPPTESPRRKATKPVMTWTIATAISQTTSTGMSPGPACPVSATHTAVVPAPIENKDAGAGSAHCGAGGWLCVSDKIAPR